MCHRPFKRLYFDIYEWMKMLAWMKEDDMMRSVRGMTGDVMAWKVDVGSSRNGGQR